MSIDRSQGYEAIAAQFERVRSQIGAALVRQWAERHFARGASILDVGCGSGVPISKALVDSGFQLAGIDASPSLVKSFRQNLPDLKVACEAVQDSSFFGEKFDGIVAVGLIFLLSPDDQKMVLSRLSSAIKPGGRFLFSAPERACDWHDMLTGQKSCSLGKQVYTDLLQANGFEAVRCLRDEGENNFFDAILTS